MDTASTALHCVSPRRLAGLLGSADSPLILDVRPGPAFDASGRLVAGALRILPGRVASIVETLAPGRSVVAYCVHGHEVSQGAARVLRESGIDASFLEGGIAAWEAAENVTMVKVPECGLPASPGHPSRWVTRERPKIDRIACPWLIRRFVDPVAQFSYVPADRVMKAAQAQGAIPYDVPDVRFSHRGKDGELCSFDALVADLGLDDPCLHALARIVRGADTGRPELTPQSAGLLAMSLGLSRNFSDDHAMLEHGMVMYDALYAWAKSARGEVHNADLFRK